MAHIRYAKLVCDACGAEVEIDPTIDKPFQSSLNHRASNYCDWGEVKGRHLCGSCYSEYQQMCADHEAALRKRFGI